MSWNCSRYLSRIWGIQTYKLSKPKYNKEGFNYIEGKEDIHTWAVSQIFQERASRFRNRPVSVFSCLAFKLEDELELRRPKAADLYVTAIFCGLCMLVSSRVCRPCTEQVADLLNLDPTHAATTHTAHGSWIPCCRGRCTQYLALSKAIRYLEDT